MFIGKMALHTGEQEGAEPALLLVRHSQEVLLQQPGKEALREVFGIMGTLPGAPDVGIDGIPTRLAEIGQCAPGFRRVIRHSPPHHAPARGEERGGSVLGRRDGITHAKGRGLPGMSMDTGGWVATAVARSLRVDGGAASGRGWQARRDLCTA